MRKLQYTFKTDTLFKMLFVKHQDLLKKLVAALLGIPLESIGQFTVRNEGMPPEILGDKFCRLDINMMVNGQQVDLDYSDLRIIPINLHKGSVGRISRQVYRNNYFNNLEQVCQ